METQAQEPQMGLNFEQVWAALMKFQESQQESREDFDRRMKETDRLMRESNEKAERETQALRESQQETERKMQETERKMQETAQVVKETARVVRETNQSIGGLNNSFGALAEHLVAPNIVEKFNALGYHFRDSGENRKFRNEKGQVLVEIDILLENDDYSVAVEVKSRPKDSDIDKFKRRLEVLRKYKDGIHDPRKIHGAIAGAIFEDKVKKAVLDAGFYVIEQTGDTMKINVPDGFKPTEW